LDDPTVTEVLLRPLAGSGAAKPILLDAFALGVLAAHPHLRPAGEIVLSPNGSEAARLLSSDEDDLGADAAGVAVAIAARWSAVVTYNSVIADRRAQTWQVPTGHPGLGTSGSGDVLAGAIAGLLARGCPPAQAAVWATYLHSSAGDRLAPRVGRLGFLARELLDELPAVLTEVEASG
jgi:NAD(P)H-hydrate repair Nnr-like enzyme with NAD(P)H-hydrate dehydratase domain